MKNVLLILLVVVTPIVYGQPTEVPSKEWQLKTAVLALPINDREDATILGYNANGQLVTLKEGTNQFICLGDDPFKDGFSVAAYHKELEPYMARGRSLKAEGKNPGEIFEIREKEVKAGTLSIPDKSTLYVASGEPDEDGNVADLKVRFVVYIPFETAESTGLPLSPMAPGAPWIMDPGTHRAHIMITPK